MKPALIIYAAKSTEDKGGSIKTQIKDVRSMKWGEEVGVYEDENASAYHGSRGAGLARAKAHAERLRAEGRDVILGVQHSDRLARGDGGEAAHLVEYSLWRKKTGVQIRSVQDDGTWTGPMGHLLPTLMGERNYEDSRRKGEATKSGIGRFKAKGKPFGGVPFGYACAPEVVGTDVIAHRVEDPTLGPVVRQVFERIADHQGPGNVARWLRANGILTKRDRPHSADSVRLLVKNELYAGRKGYPALVTQELCDAANAALVKADPVATQRRQGGRPADPAYVLRSIPKCRSCGESLYSTRRYGRGERSYTCSSKMKATGCDCPPISAALLEEHTLSHLDSFMDSVADWIAEVMTERSGERHVHEDRLDAEKAALAKLDLQREQRMAELKAVGFHPVALEAVEALDRERESQAQRIEEAESMLAEWTSPAGVDEALDFYSALTELVQGRVKQAQGVRPLNEALSALLAGMWAEIRDGRLLVEFELRTPLGSTPRAFWTTSGRGWLPAVQVGAWPKSESPLAKTPANRATGQNDDRQSVSQTPDSTSIQSVCRRFSEASTSRMIQRRELPA
jgi:DNA invertase Pin-like site-specific DNA recombinase